MNEANNVRQWYEKKMAELGEDPYAHITAPQASKQAAGSVAERFGLNDYIDSQDRWALARMVAMRLRLKDGADSPFEALHAHKMKDNKVVVFVLHNGTPIILEDNEALFPSDALVSQLRLLVG